MDIINHPPSIPEDTVQYTIYPPQTQSDKSSVTTYAACMRLFVESLLQDFLWNRDAFELKVVQDPDGQGWLIEGRMRVGDCIDDEWCLAWLLKELSTRWDVAISVFDTDGEFLLIEAAEVLPTWVKPSNSENRVWIYGAHLHLIPVSHVSPPSRKRRRRPIPHARLFDDELEQVDDEDYIAVQDALKLVRDSGVPTLAPKEMEKIVWQRLSSYPSALKDHVHTTKAYLPVDVAKALFVDPSLVQRAVETFYTRDAAQLRGVHRMARFPPEPSVVRRIRMTRTAYAQLLGQRFHPPKVFGVWREHEGSPGWKWRDVGMKIACGFEMLYQESKCRVNSINVDATSSAGSRREALRHNPDYAQYIRDLGSVNYFRGEQEGSHAWVTLENKAADLFLEVRRADDSSRQSFAGLVTTAISRITDTLPDETGAEEDPDDWLNVDAEDFEDVFAQRMGVSQDVSHQNGHTSAQLQGQNTAEDRVAHEQASKLRNLAQKVEEFVEGEGDMEGAMFKDDIFSDEEDSSDEDEYPEMDDDARQSAMDKLVPGLAPSEYGKMPASFHNNSQKLSQSTKESHERPGNSAKIGSPSKPIRPPILPRNEFDGVSDDETDEESADDEEDEEDRPQVVGEIEVDMAEEEEEFLEFSRQTLGITDGQWNDIIRDRKTRGAFLPTSATSSAQAHTKPVVSNAPTSSPTATTNPKLDSFEAVMQAMDAELARQKQGTKLKGKRKADEPVSDEMQDIETAMEAELRMLLEKGEEDEDGPGEEPVDYQLIKNFLESFKSQAGLAGPVSSLAGRLEPGWSLPRDDAV